MNNEAASRLLAVLMLHERKEDRNGVYCSECAQAHPCRTVRFATMTEDPPTTEAGSQQETEKEVAPNRS